MAELRYVVPKYRINIVACQDQLFGLKEERILQFCDEMDKFRRTIPWDVRWNIALTAKNNKLSLFKKLKESGCYVVGVGFESHSVKVLRSMRKPATKEQIDTFCQNEIQASILVVANLIFGDRSETPETAMETLAFWRKYPKLGIAFSSIAAEPRRPT